MNGIINVYKEENFTSFDVVAKLRGILRQKKIGHTGTLDPAAQGVLPVCLGKATKVCELLAAEDKEYVAVLLLGITTDTQDMTGTIQRERPVSCAKEEVASVIASFVGDYDQIPPMYSAHKINGRKLYDLARSGIEIDRETRHVHIYEIEILSLKLPRVWMRVKCSKGTYIRTLCHDIGARLSCGGCMESLLRTRVAGFALEHAHKLADIEKAAAEGRIAEWILPADTVFPQYPKVVILQGHEKLLFNGNKLPVSACREWKSEWRKTYLRVYDNRLQFVGIYKWIENCLKPVKFFGT